ncbi:probable pectinesterase 29 [Salvia miltiorrhiza]|uniref:probable pectinesterase 29 n=1 Tax=Salvia miltiorrhiza TaxID=226208 RepID=UPI0025AC08A2|nr:probable pectinesterase 29 [Salvia miltiorrhiza]
MARFLLCALLTCTVVFVCNRFTNGIEDMPTINVDKSQNSSFSSIQAAIDSVPSNNKNWISISVSAGVYNEQVEIPSEKPFIYVKGEGMDRTSVVWDGHGSILTSATFTSFADNIVVSGITFVNSYNYPPSKNVNPVMPAVAARISGDQSAFRECGFLGYQDTLLDDKGKHYFMLCTIEGAVDFIFGNGQSIYEKCNISLNVGIPNPGSTGYIAAQARQSPEQRSGFVFKGCSVGGEGHALLGRAWKPYSRVIYYACSLSNVVVPRGWDAWDFVGQESRITFVDEECWGAGSNKSERVKWEKTLTPQELDSFTSISYIDTGGWIRKLPIHIN